MITPKTGNIFTIPLSANKYVVAKVVWISEKYRDVFGFVLSKNVIEDPDNASIEFGNYKPIPLYTGDVFVLYGDLKNIVNGTWKVIGNIPLSKGDDDLLQHNIGGSLYKGDIFIRKLSDQELDKYPKFLNAGDKAIVNILGSAYS